MCMTSQDVAPQRAAGAQEETVPWETTHVQTQTKAQVREGTSLERNKSAIFVYFEVTLTTNERR